MPRKKTKRLAQISEQAMKIKCQYCDIKETCTRRSRKESHEKSGIITRCVLTPNRLKRK